MSAQRLLADLERARVRLEVVGDRLRIDGAPEDVTDELVERIRAAKPELLRLLADSAPTNDVAPPPDASDPTPTAETWAAYFQDYPEELARLAARAAEELPPSTAVPSGRATTAMHWAQWFAERTSVTTPKLPG